jgi:LacI family transcriptional regulator
MLTNSEGDPELDAKHLHLFLRRRVDGIILSTAETSSPEVARALLDPTVPFVVLDRDTPPHSRVSSVYGDHAAGMQDATAHLIQRGHTAVALISGPEQLKPARERVRGFRAAFEAAGLKPVSSKASTKPILWWGATWPWSGATTSIWRVSTGRPSAW